MEAACGFLTEAEGACFLRKQVDLQGACFERHWARRFRMTLRFNYLGFFWSIQARMGQLCAGQCTLRIAAGIWARLICSQLVRAIVQPRLAGARVCAVLRTARSDASRCSIALSCDGRYAQPSHRLLLNVLGSRARRGPYPASWPIPAQFRGPGCVWLPAVDTKG